MLAAGVAQAGGRHLFGNRTGGERALTEMLFGSNARQSFGGSSRFHPAAIFKVH
jgi:hypothetical protein